MNSPGKADDETNPPAPHSKRRGGRNKQRKSANVNSNAPPSATNHEGSSVKSPPASSGFADGNAALEATGLGLSGRYEEVFSRVKSEKFFQVVDSAYDQLVASKKDLTVLLSRAEWRHIHALFLYSRISDCEFAYSGKKQSAPNRIPLPYDVSVFQPIWAILSDIGIVEDPELRVRYIPQAAMPRSDDQSDLNDISEMLDCTQYNWTESWRLTKADRNIRKEQLADYTGHVENFELADEVPTNYEELKQNCMKVLSNLKEFEAADWADDEQLGDIELCEHIVSNEDGTYTLDLKGQTFRISSPKSAETAFKSVFKWIKEFKTRRLSAHLPRVSNENVQFKLEDEQIPSDPGAYGRRLGWDPELWMSYKRFVDTARPIALFSPSFPKESTGTYMWLIPVESSSTGIFCRLPRQSIPNATWLLALILDMSCLHTRRTCTWSVYTDSTPSTYLMVRNFIGAAIKSGLPVEVFR